MSAELKTCVILGVRSSRPSDGRGRDGNCAKEGEGGEELSEGGICKSVRMGDMGAKKKL